MQLLKNCNELLVWFLSTTNMLFIDNKRLIFNGKITKGFINDSYALF